MTQLLEIKDKLIKLYGNYELYVKMAIKFVIAFVAFSILRIDVGFMSKISNWPVTLVLSLLCCILPVGGMLFVASLVIVANMYALSMEAALVTFLLLAILYLLYFRFAPKDGYMALLTPIAFKFNIPYLVPVAGGLTRSLSSAVSMVCGTVLFYFLDGVHKSAAAVAGASGEADANSKLNVIVGQITNNKEMFLVIGVMLLTYLLVSLIRRMDIDNAWTIAIVTGVIFQLLGLIAGYLIIGVPSKIVPLIVGTIISALLSYIVKFFFMELDYARTERVQFEDDDYYYYVKAVPKKMVASKEKTVKRFGNTSTMGKKIDHRARNEEHDTEIGRRVIAKELDIDEDLLK